MKRLILILSALAMLLAMTACSAEEMLDTAMQIMDEISTESDLLLEDAAEGAFYQIISPDEKPGTSDSAIVEDGVYTHKDEVALYIYTYGDLPDNFITKNEARDLGWSGGGLEEYAPGMCIGGDHFGNYEGLLPEAEGRSYTECDIDTLGADSRGAKRIIFSNDGLIYYTEDHYESFELLYGTP